MAVLVIAPHPDDEAIGCGGTIARLVAAGDAVEVAFLTSGERALPHLDADEARAVREREAGDAAATLGGARLTFLRLHDWTLERDHERGVEAVAAAIERVAPDAVYAPHPGEWHPDHRAAAKITLAAAERCGLRSSALLAYEIWTPLSAFSVVEDIGEVMERKLDAIRCYASQNGHFDYVAAASGLGQYRGALAGRCRYAEVFARW